MREYETTEHDKTILASFKCKCKGCDVYLVKDIDIRVKRTSWWSNGPQSNTVKTSLTEGVHVHQYGYRIECPKCKNGLYGKTFTMRVTEHKCGAKCVNSKGHVCECSCGGKNHGSGYAG